MTTIIPAHSEQTRGQALDASFIAEGIDLHHLPSLRRALEDRWDEIEGASERDEPYERVWTAWYELVNTTDSDAEMPPQRSPETEALFEQTRRLEALIEFATARIRRHVDGAAEGVIAVLGSHVNGCCGPCRSGLFCEVAIPAAAETIHLIAEDDPRHAAERLVLALAGLAFQARPSEQ